MMINSNTNTLYIHYKSDNQINNINYVRVPYFNHINNTYMPCTLFIRIEDIRIEFKLP